MGLKFGSGLRTDGREVRPHKPWRVNDGKETANRTVAPGVNTPPTNFASAFDPKGLRQATGTLRLGGMNPTTGPLARSTSFEGQQIARREAELDSPLWAGHRPLVGPTLAKDGAPLTGRPALQVPSDSPSAPSMFSNVTDAGAEPVQNTAQRWTAAGRAKVAAGGWTVTDPAQAQNIARRFAPKANRIASNGFMRKEDQPY